MYDSSCSAEPVQNVAFLDGQFKKPRGLEQSGPEVQRYQSRAALQLRGNRKNKEEQKMVGGCKINSRLLNMVAELYDWLDLQISNNSDLAGPCEVCGRCCDFVQFDHRLFVTPPELMYLAAYTGDENIKPMSASRCSYNVDGKCTIYENRFASCRIFYCRGDADFQNRLSESALKNLKSLCTQLGIPYRYTDLHTALKSYAG
jgi:Fe-S-cluster containining protein